MCVIRYVWGEASECLFLCGILCDGVRVQSVCFVIGIVRGGVKGAMFDLCVV